MIYCFLIWNSVFVILCGVKKTSCLHGISVCAFVGVKFFDTKKWATRKKLEKHHARWIQWIKSFCLQRDDCCFEIKEKRFQKCYMIVFLLKDLGNIFLFISPRQPSLWKQNNFVYYLEVTQSNFNSPTMCFSWFCYTSFFVRLINWQSRDFKVEANKMALK